MNFFNRLFSKKSVPIRSYEDFWNWFQLHEKSFHRVVKQEGDIDKYFFSKIGPKLDELRDGFWYVTGMSDEETVELIITADGAVKNIVFAEELIQAAPKLPGWKFTALKPSLNLDDVSIEMEGIRYTKDNLHFYPNEDDQYPDEISITVIHDEYKEGEDDMLTGVFIFLDNYLGELDFANTIDSILFSSKSSANKELIPIGKLKDYLIWREKEFVEKYEATIFDSSLDSYSVYEASLENEGVLIAVLNSALLSWESKASHPWIVTVNIPYDGKRNNGLPEDSMMELLESIESEITRRFEPEIGILYIGRQSAKNMRSIYFACREFRIPSKILSVVQQEFLPETEIQYEINKDKYWQTFNRFGS
jgi:hypothetical protein